MRALFVLSVLFVCPALVHAQTAAELIEHGIALREDGRDEEALAFFEEAYQDIGSGEALAQIALAEHALGRLVEAEHHLVSALAETNDRFVRRNHVALEQALAELRAGLGELEIRGGEPGAEVWIGEVSHGILPLTSPIRVLLGPVHVEIRQSGHAAEESTVEVTSGAVAILELAAPPAPIEEPVVVRLEPEPLPTAIARSEPLQMPVGVAAASLGVVLVGVATGLMVLREDSARARLTCSDTDPGCRAQFQTAVDAEAAGIALYVVGGLFMAGGAVLVVLDLLGHPGERDSARACAPGVLSVSCRF